jgi:hypothetical protein
LLDPVMVDFKKFLNLYKNWTEKAIEERNGLDMAIKLTEVGG